MTKKWQRFCHLPPIIACHALLQVSWRWCANWGLDCVIAGGWHAWHGRGPAHTVKALRGPASNYWPVRLLRSLRTLSHPHRQESNRAGRGLSLHLHIPRRIGGSSGIRFSNFERLRPLLIGLVPKELGNPGSRTDSRTPRTFFRPF